MLYRFCNYRNFSLMPIQGEKFGKLSQKYTAVIDMPISKLP